MSAGANSVLFVLGFVLVANPVGAQTDVVQPKPVFREPPPQSVPHSPRVRLPKPPVPHEIEPLKPPRQIPKGPLFGQVPKDRVRTRQHSRIQSLDKPDPEIQELLEKTLRPVVLFPETRVRVTGEGVAMREGPGIDFPKETVLGKGEAVTLLDIDDDWYRIRIASGTEGWIFSDYAARLEPKPAVVTGERVNLRREPAMDSQVIGNLYQGAIVLADFQEGEWTEVSTPNLPKAYIASQFLKPLPPHVPVNPPLVPFPGQTRPVASLAKLTQNVTGETSYLLAVWGDEWVKLGKTAILLFSRAEPSPLTGVPAVFPRCTEGAFFQKTLFKKDWNHSFSGQVQFPDGVEAVTVAYLRGKKKNQVWTFEITLSDVNGPGAVALVCQEGPFTGTYLTLEEKEVR